MAILTFDTYEFIQALKEAGFDETQAKGIADSIKKIDLAHVSTKEDIARLETKMESFKSDVFKWIFPMMLGQVAVIAALVKLL
ncbi:MAG: DUF1640 domain-containing protein [Cyanobacteriota bacterium]|nr:DUF1640 domain-containing protein [Cyanobacteriota bacterium]